MTKDLKQRLAAWLKVYWPFLLPPLLILPGLADFPYPGSGGSYSDVVLTHYPNAVFLKQSLLTEGVIPLWSSRILSGFPFVAHPYSGLWYPPAWLALLFPLPLGLNLMVAVHLIVAGAGLYAFLRRKGISRQAAILGGLAFEASPKLFAHYGAGHLMLVSAVCLTPLLFWASMRQKNPSGRWEGLIQPGVFIALIFLADPRWAFYAAMAWLSWRIAHSRRGGLLNRLFSIFNQLLLAALLALPAIWLFAEFAFLSTRASLSPQEVLKFSLPLSGLLALLKPQWAGFHEWMIYPGVLLLPLGFLLRHSSKRRIRHTFWVLIFLATLAISLGGNLPGMLTLARLPGFSLLRIPPRALFLTMLALAILAAEGMEILLGNLKLGQIKNLRLSLLGLLAFLLLLTYAFFGQAGEAWRAPLWAASLLVVFWFSFEFRRSARISVRFFFLCTVALLLLDLALIDASLIRFRSKEVVLAESEAVAQYLSGQPGQFRVYSASYNLSQQSAVLYRLEQADGIDPIQLASYTRYMTPATGVRQEGYSVTLPPFPDGDPRSSTIGYQPDAEALGYLNIAFVLSEFPLEAEGLELRERFGGTFVYSNSLVKPRTWLQSPDGGEREVELLEWGPNRIRLSAQGPGTLVLSEIFYPGWQARMDGELVEVERFADILRSVELGKGQHIVEFRFLPAALIWGLPISSLTLGLLLFWPRARGLGQE